MLWAMSVSQSVSLDSGLQTNLISILIKLPLDSSLIKRLSLSVRMT